MIRLNIGLKRNDACGTIEAGEVVRDLGAMGLDPVEVGLAMSDSEPTLIVDVARVPGPAEVDFLCRKYMQDCFAAYDFRAGSGDLLGPKAGEWGPFNPEYFVINTAGGRLSPRARFFPLEV